MSVKFFSTAFEIDNLCNFGSSEKLQFICALIELCNFEVLCLILQNLHFIVGTLELYVPKLLLHTPQRVIDKHETLSTVIVSTGLTDST